MLTRCPNCDTHFRLTSQQIKVRAGVVRCGACDAVFNALETLVDEPLSIAIENQAKPENFSTDPTATEPLAPVQMDIEPRHEASIEEHTSDSEVDLDMVTELADANHHEHELTEAPSEVNFDFVNFKPGAELDYEIQTNPEPEPETSTELLDYLATPIVPNAGPPARRWPWILGSAVAMLTLLLQATYYYRVDLSVLRPGLRPVLQAACKPFNCEVPRPRHIETLGIETSDLRPDPQQAGYLTLNASLRNQAAYAQEWPLLELTLTDVTDQKLAVKHFTANDYLPQDMNSKQTIANGFPAKGEVAISLPLDVAGLPAAGYRLYVFYP